MIVVDTNVLLRYLLKDDEVQGKKAAKLIKGITKVLLPDAVLVETVWTLEGRKYRLGKNDIVQVLLSLFREPNITFEDGQVVWKALHAYRRSKVLRGKAAGFADALIVCKSRMVIEKKKEPFAGVYTFDNAVQQLDGARKP